MRLLAATVLQRKAKRQLAQYFYSEVLELPHQDEIDQALTRWFTHPMLLESRTVDPTELQQPKGGFTGIQLNVYPTRQVYEIVKAFRAMGYKPPEVRSANGLRVVTVQDPTGNVITVVGHPELPEGALTNKCIGAVSVFVTSLARSRGFYEQVVGLPFQAAPHPGMMVLGAPGETSLLLYQAERGQPETPVGRLTSYTFGTTDMPGAIEKLEGSEGRIVERTTDPDSGEVVRLVFKDPERNTYTLVDEATMALPEPLPVKGIVVEEPDEPMDRGAALELDDEPAFSTVLGDDDGDDDDEPLFGRDLELDDVGTFDRDLELD